jgi:hypothetical protein
VPTTIDQYSLATVPVMQLFNDTVLGNATAFVWRHNGQHFLITNWHVVTARNNETGVNLHPKGGRPNRLRLYFNPAQMLFGKHEADQELFLPDGAPVWCVHPVHGRAVDVVAIPLPPQPEHLHFRPINEMSSDQLLVSVGMDVFILGYPFGFEAPGYPVWKRGSVASEPDLAPLTHNYMLIDSASRPGMSGAPVIRRSWGNHQLENGGVVMGPGSATRFVGVYSGRLHTNDPNDPQLARVWPRALLEEIVQVPTRDTLDA